APAREAQRLQRAPARAAIAAPVLSRCRAEGRRWRAVARRALPLRIPVRQAARSDQRAARRSAQHVLGPRPIARVRRLLPERAAQRRGGFSLCAAGLSHVAAGGGAQASRRTASLSAFNGGKSLGKSGCMTL